MMKRKLRLFTLLLFCWCTFIQAQNVSLNLKNVTVIGPAAPNTAPKIGDSLSDPLKMYLGDIYTISVNLAGLPGMSVPCGRDAKGLPIGLQLIGDCFKEKNIIRAAYAYEQTRKYEAPKLAKTAEGEAK